MLTTLTTVGYGDIDARTTPELIIAIIFMFFGVGFYSYFIGMLTSVLQYISVQETTLKKNIEIMNELCNSINISDEVKKKNGEYFVI